MLNKSKIKWKSERICLLNRDNNIFVVIIYVGMLIDLYSYLNKLTTL